MKIIIETQDGPQSVEVAPLEAYPGIGITEQPTALPGGHPEYAMVHLQSGQCFVSRGNWRSVCKLTDTIGPLTNWDKTADELQQIVGIRGDVRAIALTLLALLANRKV